MIVNHAYIFVHVPKTGGQSVAMALGGRSSGPLHAPLRCVDKGSRFAFGFIRNPWARMVSLYRFLCQKTFRDTDNFDQEKVRAMGFRKWLMEDEFFMQQDHLPRDEPWVMWDKWRGDGDTDLLPMQRRPQMWWLGGCDFIGKTENMAEDFRRACRLMDMTPPRLGHVNATKGGDWQPEYDMPSRRFVEKHFAPDIEFGGYRFG